MTTSEINNPQPPSPLPADPDDLRSQVESLRHTLASVLVLVLIVSGTLNIFFWRQFKTTRAELRQLQPSLPQIANQIGLMQDFVRKLTEYSKTHPDFAPIAIKYNLNSLSPTGAPPAMVGPRPVATPPTGTLNKK